MFGPRHYVPILRWKQGERLALKALRKGDRDWLTPLIEIPRKVFEAPKKQENQGAEAPEEEPEKSACSSPRRRDRSRILARSSWVRPREFWALGTTHDSSSISVTLMGMSLRYRPNIPSHLWPQKLAELSCSSCP
jgi:hypothetical protein